MTIRLLVPFVLAASAFAQAPAAKSVIGTVASVGAGVTSIEVKPDTGASVSVKVTSATTAQKVAPGQTDLSKAESIQTSAVVVGDRVLVTLSADGAEARRIIVIPATDLAKRDAADRADWQKRGVAGVVTAVAGGEITVELRSLGGATKFTVSTTPKTNFKRYASNSVRYADAKVSNAGEVSVGDQLRARGQKSADGLKVDAEDVVFGTFLSKAGTITAVNPASHELTIKDLSNNKPLVVTFIADSQVKRMPDAAAMSGMLMAAGRGATPGAAPGASGRGPAPPAPAPNAPATAQQAATVQGRGAGPAPNAAAMGSGRGPAPGAQRGPDIVQILELLPPIKFEDLKPGEVAVVSALQGAKADQITAITFLANAETLVQLAMAARGVGATGPAPSLAGLASSISSVGP